MQPGVVGLRAAVTAAWEDDLRAVRQDSYETGAGKEALAFIQRFYALVSLLRTPIQRAWGPGGLVHVADNPDVAGPGQRVSQTRVKLRNHGDLVAIEAFTYTDGTAKANPALGLDREIKVAGVGGLLFVQELHRTMVTFLQAALGVDLQLPGSAWLYEQIAASYFVANAKWPTVGEVYQRATRELAVDDSFEKVIATFASEEASNGETEIKLSLEQLDRCRDTQAAVTAALKPTTPGCNVLSPEPGSQMPRGRQHRLAPDGYVCYVQRVSSVYRSQNCLTRPSWRWDV